MTGANRGSSQQPRTGVGQATRGLPFKSLNICTYNTRTINDLNEDSLEIMLHEIKDIKWDIIGLAETKMKESKIEILEASGHHLVYSQVMRSLDLTGLVSLSTNP